MDAPHPEIDVWPDYVMIDGQRVNRPSRISAVQWTDYWERIIFYAYSRRC